MQVDRLDTECAVYAHSSAKGMAHSAMARMNVLFVCMYSNEACHTQMKLYLIQLPLG